MKEWSIERLRELNENITVVEGKKGRFALYWGEVKIANLSGRQLLDLWLMLEAILREKEVIQ
jgi:hypothetical protein